MADSDHDHSDQSDEEEEIEEIKRVDEAPTEDNWVDPLASTNFHDAPHQQTKYGPPLLPLPAKVSRAGGNPHVWLPTVSHHGSAGRNQPPLEHTSVTSQPRQTLLNHSTFQPGPRTRSFSNAALRGI